MANELERQADDILAKVCEGDGETVAYLCGDLVPIAKTREAIVAALQQAQQPSDSATEKLAAMLQGLEFQPIAATMPASVLGTACAAIAKQAKRAADSEAQQPSAHATCNGLIRQAQASGNGLYGAIVKVLEKFIDPATRDLEWDVLPGTIKEIAERAFAQQPGAQAVACDDAAVERALVYLAFQEDGAQWPDSYSEEEQAMERETMRGVLAAANCATGPRAYCRACQAVGMSNCQHFDECSGATCITCHRPFNTAPPPLPEGVSEEDVEAAWTTWTTVRGSVAMREILENFLARLAAKGGV